MQHTFMDSSSAAFYKQNSSPWNSKEPTVFLAPWMHNVFMFMERPAQLFLQLRLCARTVPRSVRIEVVEGCFLRDAVIQNLHRKYTVNLNAARHVRVACSSC